ncbi:hypothetical protein BN1723_013896 [Verticillium longisporum]|uniref:lytic cellulose monooxygenase (C4-dehydrogenating) n=1 Tax=Verticillium longisporum TaxID=100787 RepID=A0A0G4LXU6_VERLO|nr:hypothetical protein BN1723_013896 [Verticillium longisporum]
MKFFSILLPVALLQVASAHYTFPAISSGGQSSANWQNVRQTANYQTTGPITNVASSQMTCYELSPGRGAPGTLAVTAGNTVSFTSSPPIFHPGPAIAYLARVPSGQTAATWNGQGAVWFKIWQDNASISSGGISWPNMNAGSVSFPLPRCLDNGEYLVRFEHIALHSASSSSGAQLYLSCGQIRVSGGSGGYKPARLLSFPGAYNANDPGLLLNIYYPVPTSYTKAKLECSSLQVPRDYTAPKSKERVTIELVRAKAKKQPSRGSILYNPGGPGLPMRSKISTDSELLQWMSGDEYDLVTFDPRGTGPLPFTCGAIGPMLSQQKPNDTLEEIWGRAGAVAAQCAKHSTGNKHAELLGTVALVRDTMQVVDALAEDGLLRFWGYSYGTIVGATAAAMFPDRIDRMVLDGVVNPHKWYRGPSDPDMTMDADKVLTAMLEMCIALGETKCPLAKHGSTAADLSAKVWRRIDDLKVQPAVITIKPKAGLSMPFPVAIKVTIDYLKAIHLTSSTLINRALWPQHLSFLASLLAVRGSEPYEAASGAAAPDVAAPSLAKRSAGDANALLSAHIAIRCGDRLERTPAFASFAPEMAATLNSSRISGARFAAMGATCAQWPWRAREAYDGDFAVTTRTPVLVVSSELDPRTPLEAARQASAVLGGSELLTVAGAGHCSTSVPSVCAALHLRDYWVNGTMPAPGKVCEGSPFGVKWADVRKEVDKMNLLHKREAYDDFDDDDFGRSFMESQDAMDYFLGTDIMDAVL